jgi:hypothetical protein
MVGELRRVKIETAAPSFPRRRKSIDCTRATQSFRLMDPRLRGDDNLYDSVFSVFWGFMRLHSPQPYGSVFLFVEFFQAINTQFTILR